MTPKMQEARESWWDRVTDVLDVEAEADLRGDSEQINNVFADGWNSAVEAAVQIATEARGEGQVDLRTLTHRILALKAQS